MKGVSMSRAGVPTSEAVFRIEACGTVCDYIGIHILQSLCGPVEGVVGDVVVVVTY